MLDPVPGYGVKPVDSLLSIGKLAGAAGVSVETIRYDQRRDLLPLPPRPLGGQRRYSDTAVARITSARRSSLARRAHVLER
ncbi:MAG: MerR family DNA-binding transcriptional regulator [Rhodanobacteraceae bacterium]